MTIQQTCTKYDQPAYYMEEDGGAYFWLEKTIADYAYDITIEEFFNSKENLAIHCETEDEADALFKVFSSMGKCWASGEMYGSKTKWCMYGEQTCYSNTGTYGNRQTYEEDHYKIYEFSHTDVAAEKIIPDDAMQVLRRDTTKWILVKYDKSRNRLTDMHGNSICEYNIMSIKNDERTTFMKCSYCGEIVSNTPEGIAEHLTKKQNCLKCGLVTSSTIKELDVSYEKQDDGTYIKEQKTSCKLYCSNSWSNVEIDSPDIAHACKYQGCTKDRLTPLGGFFSKYPNAFDTVATVDALGDNWKYTYRAGINCMYEYKGRQRIVAVVNHMGIITQFEYSYYDNTYTFVYSAKYNKIIWINGYNYSDTCCSSIKERTLTVLMNIIKEIYEEK